MGEWLSEDWLHALVANFVRIVEFGAALVIFVGVAVGLVRFASEEFRGRGARSFQRIRLTVGRYLALGLELQLGADLLRTSVAPTWQQIGQLAAVAALRTALNYFLQREIAQEESRSEPGGTTPDGLAGSRVRGPPRGGAAAGEGTGPGGAGGPGGGDGAQRSEAAIGPTPPPARGASATHPRSDGDA